MNEDVRLSRLRVSRRRALAIGGTVGFTGLLAACAGNGSTSAASTSEAPAGGTVDDVSDIGALLDQAGTCTLSQEQTQGP